MQNRPGKRKAREADRLIVACVAEPREPYCGEVELLFRTLRRLGGNLAGARAVAYFVGRPGAEIRKTLAALDVSVRIVDPFDARCPHANKLRMLECRDEYEYLLALDTDIAVAGDFSSEILGASIAAKPADQDLLTIEEWSELFSGFGLELPQARYVTSFALKETIPYFNSGVLLLPRPFVDPLREQWSTRIRGFLDAPEKLRANDKLGYYIDQIALALALAAGRFPIRALPLSMNFPTHSRIHGAHRPGRIQPLLLHHHHRRAENGTLRHCTHEVANRCIDQVNQAILAIESAAFSGNA